MNNNSTSPDGSETRIQNQHSKMRRITAIGLLVTLGIVFGDIGTSPLYVMKAITGVNPDYDPDYIIGAVSCVIWTLTLQTTVKYVLIALRADNKGEGGILSLFALLRKLPRRWLYLVAAIGASTLIADGVITPAVTVTSAIEGLTAVDQTIPVIPIVILIITGIFLMQRAGTGTIGKFFGPFMLIWFLTLGILGTTHLGSCPAIWKAFNPWYAARLLIDFPGWFLILGAVFLCTTGAEALYSDLGHCGRLNISVSWIFVKIMLILNYLGQGAWLIASGPENTAGQNPFYGIMPQWFVIPGVILAAGAAIIASQALLSGSFTIFSEAMSLNFWPRIRVKYPSDEKGQLYIPAVNWTLLAGCLATVMIFRNSAHMEAAYGLAITITMLMTTLLLAFWLHHKGTPRWIIAIFLLAYVAIEGCFFVANLFKFMHGGWFTILIAGIVAFVMISWRNSSRIKESFTEWKRLGDWLGVISEIKADRSIPKYASNIIYFSRSASRDLVESKMMYSIVNKQPKRADHYWIIRLEYTDDPHTLEYSVSTPIEGTLYCVHLRMGYRVEPQVSLYLRQIVEDLVAEGKLDLRSGYPSLHKRGIAGDFRFIVLRRIFSPGSSCKKSQKRLMHLHDIISRLGITDQSALGLDTSSVVTETAPLIINSTPARRIVRI